MSEDVLHSSHTMCVLKIQSYKYTSAQHHRRENKFNHFLGASIYSADGELGANNN